jgi:hypothetical protein
LGKVGDDQCKFQRALRPPERGLAHVVRHRDAADQQLADCDQHRDLPPQIAGRTIARVVERAGHHGVTGAPHPHEVNLRLRDPAGQIGKLGRAYAGADLILRSPPTAGVSKDGRWHGSRVRPSFETPCCARLLRTRSRDAVRKSLAPRSQGAV